MMESEYAIDEAVSPDADPIQPCSGYLHTTPNRAIQLSVVIVNWNGCGHLRRCLKSLFGSLDRLSLRGEVIIVDNGSTDGSIELIENLRRHDLILIKNTCNLGFSKANNQAFAIAKGKYIATLNNDTVVDPEWLEAPLEILEKQPAVGSVAVQMRLLHAPDRLDSAGLHVDYTGFAFGRLRDLPIECSEREPTCVFGPCAGAAVYRASLLKTLRGFDEHFTTYHEDADLAWRARRAGWTCVYEPNSVVYHVGSATSSKTPRRTAYLNDRNRIWLFAKNASRVQFFTQLPRFVMHELVSTVYHIGSDHSFSPVESRFDAVVSLPQVLRQRGEWPHSVGREEFSPPLSVAARCLRRAIRLRKGQGTII